MSKMRTISFRVDEDVWREIRKAIARRAEDLDDAAARDRPHADYLGHVFHGICVEYVLYAGSPVAEPDPSYGAAEAGSFAAGEEPASIEIGDVFCEVARIVREALPSSIIAGIQADGSREDAVLGIDTTDDRSFVISGADIAVELGEEEGDDG